MNFNHLGFSGQVRENRQLATSWSSLRLSTTGNGWLSCGQNESILSCPLWLARHQRAGHTMWHHPQHAHHAASKTKIQKKKGHPWLLLDQRKPKPRGSELASNRGATWRQDELLDCIAFQKTPPPSGKTNRWLIQLLRSSSHKSRHQRLRNKVVLGHVPSESKKELF